MATLHPSRFGFAGAFHEALEDREKHSAGAGILGSLPAAVAVPRDAADVQALLRWASAVGATIVPRGAATGMPGGNVGPGVAIDLLTGFRAPPRIDPLARTADVGPGVTLAELNRAAAPLGLRFPVDPSSGSRCSIGGMIANNAAGAHSVLYGATRSWVRTLDVVLADGTAATLTRAAEPPRALSAIAAALDHALAPLRGEILARWPRVSKNSSGYALAEYFGSGDLLDLIVGSEGTLAILTRASLRLAPIPPATGLALARFASLEAAGRAVLSVLPLRPATCEILDRTFLDLVRRGEPRFRFPAGVEALLLIEVERADQPGVAAAIGELREALGSLATGISTADDPVGVHALWEIRHAASPIIAREAAGRVPMQFIEDSVVPVECLPEFILELRRILHRHRLPAVIFGHAGDGNLHVNPLVDVRQPDWSLTLDSVLAHTTDLVARLGGTLAGEHGDGRLRAPLLRQIWGEPAFSAFRAVKDAFDPLGILNPGVVLPLPGQRPLDLLHQLP
jgi:FAD/FMN-containing dehydrogenase